MLRWIWSTPYVYQGTVIIGAAIAGWGKVQGNNARGLIQSVVGLGLAFVGGACGVIYSVVAQRRRESPHELVGCLHTLHAAMTVGVSPKTRLRVTVYVPVKKNTQLEQLVEYVEDDGKKRSGRRYLVQTGIIGEAYRTGQPQEGKRTAVSAEDFVAEMVSEWGYTKEQAESLSQSVYAWMAIPLMSDESRVQAIVFFDCTEKEFFSDAKRELAGKACAGIARFIRKRYT
jgi:hypothetical protein